MQIANKVRSFQTNAGTSKQANSFGSFQRIFGKSNLICDLDHHIIVMFKNLKISLFV